MSNTVNIILYIVAVSVVLLSAIFGNILVIVCCVTFRKLKTITNILICNLAVSDILLAGVVLPQKLHDMLHEDHFFEGRFYESGFFYLDVFFSYQTFKKCLSFSFRSMKNKI